MELLHTEITDEGGGREGGADPTDKETMPGEIWGEHSAAKIFCQYIIYF